MVYENILVEPRDKVGLITLNWPEALKTTITPGFCRSTA